MPYQLASKYGPKFKDTWNKATDEFLKQTGIEWVQKGPSHSNYVYVKDNGQGSCASKVGKHTSTQALWLCELLVLLLYINIFGRLSTYRIAAQ